MSPAEQPSQRAGVAGDSSARIRRYRANIQAELDRAAVYQAMADAERDPELARGFQRLAKAEKGHAEFWRGQLAKAGSKGAPHRPSVRARLLARLAAQFGSRLVHPAAASLEMAEQQTYEHQPEAGGTMSPADEREHARVLDTAVEASIA